MNNLVEILSGKHGNVTLMMNASERKKLARMRDFLCAEDEVYEKLDHYDIASMTDAELDGLLDLSFDADQIALPDDVEALLEDLRRDIGEEEIPTAKGGDHVSFWGRGQRYAIAASIFVALFVPAYLATSSNGHIAAMSDTSPKIEVSGIGSEDALDTVMLSPTEPQVSLPHGLDIRDSAAGLSFGSLSSVVPTSDLMAASVIPDTEFAIASSMTGFLPALQDVWVAEVSNQDRSFLPYTASASVAELLQASTGGWTLSEGRGVNTEQFAEQVISAIELESGEDIATRATVEGNNRNIIVQLDGQELHIFNLTLTEGESVYTVAQEAEVDPNVFRLINRALEEGPQIDTTTMALNDRIVGIASRQGDHYVLADLFYDRARSSDMLVYSNCANLEQAVSLLPPSLDSQACTVSASVMSSAASTDLP